MDARRQRLEQARLYLVCDDRPDQFLDAALRGGVDIVQLRVKQGPDAAILAAARRFAAACARRGALFIINDRPDLVRAAGADGVHVGQGDLPPARARELIGDDRLVGLSTHTPEQVDGAAGLPVDYIGVGPVHATPTKPGRPPVGLQLVSYAAANATVPFFAIGGISTANAGAVHAAGAARIAVVRALTEATEPERVAAELRALIAGGEPTEHALGQRSRKRGRRSKPAPAAVAAEQRVGAGAASSQNTTVPGGRPRQPPAAVPDGRPQQPPAAPPGRSEQRNAAVRATLVPFAAGERPWSIKIAALIALTVGAGDLVDVILGGRTSFGGTHTGIAGVVLFSLLMIVCAVGMWQMRYWAVLGFQAVLAIVVLIFALLLVRASNLLGFVVPIVIIGAGGTLFYKLVRVLSRLQMPKYPGR
jgi:thiamine-phosphate pyrophosphorylase